MFVSKSGFALIELIIVVAVLGILLAVALTSSLITRAKATDNRVRSDLNQLRGLAEIMYDSNLASYGAEGTPPSVADCFEAPNSTNCRGGIETDVVQVVADLQDAIGADADLTVNSQPTSYCLSHNLKTDTSSYVCVDASGVIQEGTTKQCSSSPTATTCPTN